MPVEANWELGLIKALEPDLAAVRTLVQQLSETRCDSSINYAHPAILHGSQNRQPVKGSLCTHLEDGTGWKWGDQLQEQGQGFSGPKPRQHPGSGRQRLVWPI